MEFLKKSFSDRWLVLKYGVSGVVGALTNMGIFFVCTHLLHLWYIAAALIAFVGAFVVNFCLHKFWTFEDRSLTTMHRQVFLYLAATLGGLCINLALLYVLVESFAVPSLIAQFVSLFAAAFGSFLFNKHRTFKPDAVAVDL